MDGVVILKTTLSDWQAVLALFNNAMAQQGEKGYKVWSTIDEAGLKRDIEEGRQYKVLQNENLLCVFSIQLSDADIWQQREQGDALYLHRIVVNTAFKGRRAFKYVLDWDIAYANENKLKYVRMDTWADNLQLIEYYKSFGFKAAGHYTTGNEAALPLQNRNLHVALLELSVHEI